MYPPQMDNMRSVSGRPDVKRLQSRRHRTLIGANGAIEVQDLFGQVIFAKPGSDGRAI